MCSFRFLSEDSIFAREIFKRSSGQTFRQSFKIFYQEQVPNVAIYLLKGQVMTQKNSVSEVFEKPALLGALEVFDKSPSDSSLEIQAGSVAIVLLRQDVRELLQLDSGALLYGLR